MAMYEVDLRSRKTGESVECICSCDDYNKAYEVADNWNKENIVDYDYEIGFDDYMDYKTDGLYASLFVIDNESEVHGVGRL